MNRRFFCAVFVLTLCARPSVSGGSSNVERVVSGGRPIVLKLSDLRSAYLLRAGVVRYDADAVTSQDVRQQLQRHFDVVLGLLLVGTPNSIETALDRLEIDRDESWSQSERNRWRQQLLQNRFVQMMRLAAYRDRGLFPQNEVQAVAPAPIFVDRYDTACAVGHLMRLSGSSAVVAHIEQSDNLVYVRDALKSVIARWTLWSGLTLEEAALIQPGYPFQTDRIMSGYEPGGPALIQDGLRYENFRFTAANFNNPPTDVPHSVCRTTPDACLGTPTGTESSITEGVGLRTGNGTYNQSLTAAYIDPVGTHWLVIGGVGFSFDMFPLIGGFAPPGTAQKLTLVFDVSPVAGDERINQLTQHSDELEGGFSNRYPSIFPPGPPNPDANYLMISRITANQNEVATVLLDRDSPTMYEIQSGGSLFSTVNFQPQQQITVETQILLINGAVIESFPLDFNVVRVPEPACAALLIVGVAAIATSQKFARKRQPAMPSPAL